MIRGKVVLDKRTKNLVKKLKPNEIAIIDHLDLDQVASEALVQRHVKAVFNLSSSITGKYSNYGPFILVKAGIPLVDIQQGDLFSELQDGDEIIYSQGQIYKDNQLIGIGKELNKEDIENKLEEARNNLESELLKFIENTLNYARKEKDLILNLTTPDIEFDFEGKHVLVVIRGPDHKDDLEVIKSYIHEIKPVIVAVDGGADACLEQGYLPDIIIGDMDSVSDRALKKASKVIVHAYPDGLAPGLERIEKMGLDYLLFPAPGTSEDVAMLLAYDNGADLITAVGSHSNMVDFLEKGRQGMASTFLVRLKVGEKLVDAKGVSKLYQSKIYSHYWLQVLMAILIPVSLIGLLSPPIKQLLQLLALKIKLIFQF